MTAIQRIRYEDRLTVSISGSSDYLYTKSGLLVANGFRRIILGKPPNAKKPVLEFSRHQILHENLMVNDRHKWKLLNPKAVYREFRTSDYCSVRVIEQMHEQYPLFRGFWYISAFDIYTIDNPVLLPMKRKS